MKLTVCTMESVLFEGEADKIIAHTPMGEITVLENHLPLITSLIGPKIKISGKGYENKIVEINSGFLEIRPHSEIVALIN